MIDCTEKALWHYRRALKTLPDRIEKRRAQGLVTRIQEEELESMPYAIAALEFALEWEQYEEAQKQN